MSKQYLLKVSQPFHECVSASFQLRYFESLANNCRNLKIVGKAVEGYLTSYDEINCSPTLPSDVLALVDVLTESPETDYSKLHEELLRLNRLAEDNLVPDRVFLSFLELLASKLSNVDQLRYWLNKCVNPAINSVGYPHDTVLAAQRVFLNVMRNGTGEAFGRISVNGAHSANPVSYQPSIETSSQLLFSWVFELAKDSISQCFDIKENDLNLSERTRFIKRSACYLLTEYGRTNAHDFFKNLAAVAADPEARFTVLNLASGLISKNYKADFSGISDTSFPSILIDWLLTDKSSIVVQIGINVLAMIIPHLRFTIDLPQMLIVLGRCICWNNYIKADFESPMVEDEEVKSPVKTHLTEIANGLNSSKSTISESKSLKMRNLEHPLQLSDSCSIDVFPLFLMIYGMFPYNLLEFSQNPSAYIRATQFVDKLPENWDSYQITYSMNLLFPKFSLNSFMTKFTKSQELSDNTRWDRIGSANDLIVHCMSLRVHQFASKENPAQSKLHQPCERSNSYSLLNMLERTYELGEYTPEKPQPIISQDSTDMDLMDSSRALSDSFENNLTQPVLKDMKTLLKDRDMVISSIHDNGLVLTDHFSPEQSRFSLNTVDDLCDGITGGEQTAAIEAITIDNMNNPHAPLPICESKVIQSKPDNLRVVTSFQSLEAGTHENDGKLSITFYQRELMLLQSEYNILKYLEKFGQYQHTLLLEERAKDAVYNGSIGDLIAANQVLRKRVHALEQTSKMAQLRMKTIQSDRQKYESNLLQRNRDMRIMNQDLSRKMAKITVEMEAKQEENDNLFKTITQNETKISRLEFRLNELEEAQALANAYKKALGDADKNIALLESKTTNFLSPTEADQVSNFLVHIKELTLARDSAEHSRRAAEVQFKRQINILQAQIRDYQEKQKNPSNRIIQTFNDFKRQSDQEYLELSNAYKDLAERYEQLNDEFGKYLIAEEAELVKGTCGNTVSTPKYLLGGDMSSSSCASESDSKSITIASPPKDSQAHFTLQNHPTAFETKYRLNSTPSTLPGIQRHHQSRHHHEHSVRIRGRGGFQSTIRHSDQ